MARLCATWMLRAVVVAVLIGKTVFAADPWLQLSSPHFELYSNLTSDRSTALINRLEAARETMSHLTFHTVNAQPIRVIAFRSIRQYRIYCADGDSTAYFLHTGYRDYIVIGADSPDIYTPAVHEYAHFVIHQQFHHLPRWLDEGLADVYSTVREKSGTIRVGLPLEERLEWLRMDGLAYNLPELFEFQQYSHRNLRSVAPRSRFYAESWILAHMLRFSPEYSSRFNDFMGLLEHGASERQAFRDVYQKSESEVQDDLAHYVKAEWLPTSLLQVSEAGAQVPFQSVPMEKPASSTILDDLSAVLGRP